MPIMHLIWVYRIQIMLGIFENMYTSMAFCRITPFVARMLAKTMNYVLFVQY